MRRHLIIGAGNAGLSAARALARLAPDDAVTIVSHESRLPYCRCLLTYYLEGEVDKRRLFAWGEKIIKENRLDFRAGKRASEIDLKNRTVRFADGDEIAADTILLATGGEPKKPDFPGAELPGIFTLRNFNDALQMQKRMRPGGLWAVAGAGLVSLKSLVALRKQGLEIELFATSSRILSQVLDEAGSELAAARLKENRVKINCGEEIVKARPFDQKKLLLTTSKGRELVVDGLLYGKGVAAASPLAVDNWGADESSFPALAAGAGGGLKVDRRLALAEDVYAAGDIAAAYDLLAQKPGRIPLWPTAGEQGFIAGCNMAGRPRIYHGGISCNSFSLFGLDFISAGFKEIPTDSEGWHREESSHGDSYRALIFHQGKLKGFILAGADNLREAGPRLMEIRRNCLAGL
jgi:NADPH-dependent 2,4-dienoyl-CoA reductase/sulfur reductase-like enzyme